MNYLHGNKKPSKATAMSTSPIRSTVKDSLGWAIGFSVYILLKPVTGLASLTLALTVYLLAEGIFEFILSFLLGALPGSTWLMLDGIITFILALMISRTWPSNAEWVIGTLVGVSMLFSGVTRLMLSLAARRLVTKFA